MAARTKDAAWEWLSLIDSDGPFLSRAALKSFHGDGLPKTHTSVEEFAATFPEEFMRWTSAWAADPDSYRAARDRWVGIVLRRFLDWSEELTLAPEGLAATSPNGTVTVTPYAALGREGESPSGLVTVVDRTDDLRRPGEDGWAANAIDRMAILLRETGTTIGLVTDGRWWALVSAAKDVTTASGVWDALLWREEPQSRDAFLSLASFTSIAGGKPEKRLARLFTESVASAEQITEALGDQVRRAVELVLQSMSDTHLRAFASGELSPLPQDPRLVYEGAVTILMRIVFLLFAEERRLLPEHDMYRSGYAIVGVREGLQREATTTSEETLDHSWEAWHRLLAASNAVYGGASFEDMRMPAYGGSLFDPERFPWLQSTDTQGRLAVRLTDRAMLAVLRAVQTIENGAMQLSFRDLDVEQIGYVYEGLLSYSAAYVDRVTIGLQGKPGFEPEVALDELEGIAEASSSPGDFATKLVGHLKKTQEKSAPRTANQIAKAYGPRDSDAEADARTRLRYALLGDDDLAGRIQPFHGLIRDDLRGFPYVVPAGGLVMTESPQRANTGTHYTPRSLAEEVVLHALEPLVYAPGPLDTEDSTAWNLKSSAEILDLKVADIAAGSGAFLVAAARYLADRLLEAREAEGAPIGGDDPKRFAIREVVARCLYGADINGMAVEMCKLSLWLISMDPGKPFSFVDDRIFHGNSLLGVTTEAQLKAQHIYPQQSMKRQLAAFDVDKDLEDAARLRRELASGQVDDADPMRSTRAKRALLAQSKEVTAKLRDVADGIIAAGLLEGGKPGRKLEERFDELAEALRDAYSAGGTPGERRRLDTIVDVGLTPLVDSGDARWRPLHWVLEAPDVFLGSGGFDAIVGNPPFLGGKKISQAMGANLRAWLVEAIARGTTGNADLVAYFLLRARDLVAESGQLGLIATNTIAQGDTREVGLDRMVRLGFWIHHAIQSKAWPSRSANLEYAAVWASGAARRGTRRTISTLLEDEGRVSGLPSRLKQSSGFAFKGVNINGLGFLLDPADAQAMIASDPRNADVLRPYFVGADLNATPEPTAPRWIIDFDSRSEMQANSYGLPAKWARERVTENRAHLDNKAGLREQWWRFEANAKAMRKATEELETFLAIAVVSKTIMPIRLGAGCLVSQDAVVFATEDYADQALLSSSLHQSWVVKYGSGMRKDPRYAPSDVLETFPRPLNTERMREAGARLERDRREIMLRRHLGLTALYNLVNSSNVLGDADVDLLRSIHVEIDHAVTEAYGWADIQLDHGFHMYRQMERWTVGPPARVEILDRLLEENQRRAAIEARSTPKVKRGKSFEESEKPEGAMF